METKNIIYGIVATILILALGFGTAALTIEPETITETVTVEKLVEVPVTVEKIVEVEVPVETITEVEVDNGNLDLVLEHIYCNDGMVEYLLDDLDDDELDQIVERIGFIDFIKAEAVAYTDKEAADELDKETYGDVTFDEDDIERVRVKDDCDEVVIDDVDFEDSDATVIVTIRFEQDDVKYGADFEVEFKDGEIDDFDILDIWERD